MDVWMGGLVDRWQGSLNGGFGECWVWYCGGAPAPLQYPTHPHTHQLVTPEGGWMAEWLDAAWGHDGLCRFTFRTRRLGIICM